MNLVVTPLNNNRWGLVLEDPIVGVSLLTDYARRTTALRGADRILDNGPRGVEVSKSKKGWATTAVFANGVRVPVGTYRRSTTARRGFNRFAERLAHAKVFVETAE